MAHDVFISYASKDKAVADAVCSYLENERIRCWIAPRDITPGKKYAQDIMDAIKGCSVMVVIFSSSANESEHVSVELERAMNRGIIIIPFRIENVMPTGEMEYYLGNRHWLDAITIPMEQHIQKLVKSIQTILGNPVSANDAMPAAAPKSRKPDAGKKNGRRAMLIAAGIVLSLLLVGGILLRDLIFPGSAEPAVKSQGTESPRIDAAQTSGAQKESPPPATAKATETSGDDQPVFMQSGKNVNAEIIDGLLIDGWVEVQLENKGEKSDFNVIVKGVDDDGNIVDIESMHFSQVLSEEIRKSSLPLSGNPVRVELYIMEDYGDTAKIQEQTLADGWVQILLANGGEEGDFNVVVKGLDAQKRIVDLESLNFSSVQTYEVRKSSIPVSGNPVSFETYIVRDYGEGPQILENELIDGWVQILLANGGEEGDFNVVVKGLDAQKQIVDLEPLNFSSVRTCEVRKSSIPVSGNPASFEAYIVRDYGEGPKILEYGLVDGWACVLLANGGEEDDFNVAVKGYDAQGKTVASDNMNFSSVRTYEVRRSSLPLSGNPVKIDVFIR